MEHKLIAAHPHAQMVRRVEEDAILRLDNGDVYGRCPCANAINEVLQQIQFQKDLCGARPPRSMIRRTLKELGVVDLAASRSASNQHAFVVKQVGAAHWVTIEEIPERTSLAAASSLPLGADRVPGFDSSAFDFEPAPATVDAELQTYLRHWGRG
jgi:hypothetical protein